MKFVCDGCGKKYATAGDPAPGKVYKLKCKACGHLIVVKGQMGTMTAIPALTTADAAAATQTMEPAVTPSPAPAPHPGIELHVEPEPLPPEPPPAPEPGTQAVAAEPPPEAAIEPLPPGVEPAPLPPEVALAVDSAGNGTMAEPLVPPPELAPQLERVEPPEASPALLDPALIPPPPELDELADFAAAAAEVMAAPAAAAGQAHDGGVGFSDLFGDKGEKKAEDPFTVAARASLPDTWAGGAPVAAHAAPPVPRVLPPPPALTPVRPRKAGLGVTPVAIIGLGVLALLGIAAWALFGHGGSPTPPPPPIAVAPAPESRPDFPKPPEPEAQPPVAEPVDQKKPEPGPDAKVAEKKPEPKPEPKVRLPERRPEKRPELRVAEKKPEPPRPPPLAEARPEPQEGELPDAGAALTQEVVDRVVGANRKAFSTCIANAASSGVTLDGRQVALRITVNTNGTVTYPTLDDQSLNTTEMGQCLKSAARLMIFPKFKGDPFHYEVPLLLTGN